MYKFKTPAPIERGGYIDGYPEAAKAGKLDEWRDHNREYFWRGACRPDHKPQTELALDPVKGFEYYTDQAPDHGYGVSAVYTPHGLRTNEKWMIKQIREGSIYPFEELKAMIEHNVHYHRLVKENLLLNLRNYHVDTADEGE